MKNFFWSLILTALLMGFLASKVRPYLDGQTRWRVNFAVQQVSEAKEKYYEAHQATPNALRAYEDADATQRKETLIDAGLLSDKDALCLADPGRFAEQPTGHTARQMDDVRRAAWGKLGDVLTKL